MVAEVVDFFVTWLSCLLADTLVLFCSNIWSLLFRNAEQQIVSQWCGKMKGLVGGCAKKRKLLFVLGATPNFVLRPKLLY